MPALKVIYRQSSYWENTTGCHKYHDSSALEDVITYCLQDKKTPSNLIGSFGVNIKQAAHEMYQLAKAYGKMGGMHLRHMVLTFSQEEVRHLGEKPLEEIYKIGTYAAQYYGFEYQIVYAIHEDTTSYHIHFVMNTVSFRSGRQYRGDKADYYAFQRYMRDFLDEYYGMRLRVLADNEICHGKYLPSQ